MLVPAAVASAGAAGGTTGFDFLAYHQAAGRILAGQPLYDPTIQQAGGFGLFYYPPPFAVAVLPFALLPELAAVWLWFALSVAMLVGGIALMPVRASVRWATLLLTGLSWPVAYALKLGQVGPILFLLFAIGWRWLDRPTTLGLAGAVGAIVKIQPGIVLAWALLTRRWGAVVVGGAVLVIAAAAATVIAGGPTIWPDYVALLRKVSSPITTSHNFTPGAVAFQMGVAEPAAAALQLGISAAVVGAVAISALRWPAEASYLVAVVASQLLSPVLWDHYAMLLLLPVAWLLERRQWWAVAIPLATSVLLLPIGIPAAVYPVAFLVTLVGLLVVGRPSRPPALAAAT